MKTYLVGGAVRDIIMGIDPKDRDYVVVGATQQEMLSLGYKKVGADFPVFLHPDTGEEYALARREKKVGTGYQGFKTDFSPDVTLDEDLARRDLTINSMAMDADGFIIDPYGGQMDIEARVFRHTSEAFVEDPLRVLRVARFVARYPHFDIHPSTLKLMTEISDSGELDSLTPERVFKEMMKAMEEIKPHYFFQTLLRANALLRVFPFMEDSDILHALFSLSQCSENTKDPYRRAVSFLASLACDFSEILNQLRPPSVLMNDIGLTRELHNIIHLIHYRKPQFVYQCIQKICTSSKDSGEVAFDALLAITGGSIEMRSNINILKSCVTAYQLAQYEPEWNSQESSMRGVLMRAKQQDAVCDVLRRTRVSNSDIASFPLPGANNHEH